MLRFANRPYAGGARLARACRPSPKGRAWRARSAQNPGVPGPCRRRRNDKPTGGAIWPCSAGTTPLCLQLGCWCPIPLPRPRRSPALGLPRPGAPRGQYPGRDQEAGAWSGPRHLGSGRRSVKTPLAVDHHHLHCPAADGQYCLGAVTRVDIGVSHQLVGQQHGHLYKPIRPQRCRCSATQCRASAGEDTSGGNSAVTTRHTTALFRGNRVRSGRCKARHVAHVLAGGLWPRQPVARRRAVSHPLSPSGTMGVRPVSRSQSLSWEGTLRPKRCRRGPKRCRRPRAGASRRS